MKNGSHTKARPRGFGAVPDVDPPPSESAKPNQAADKDTLPPIEDAAEMLADVRELPPEIVEGIVHRGAKMVIGGGSKSYKTWILLYLAHCVATGQEWLGFPTVAGRVLYINLEIQRGFFRVRLEEISKATGVPVGNLDVWNLRGQAADISRLIGEILRRVGQQYAMIIVDPIYKVLGTRDENAAGDIGSMLNELERLAVSSGAAVVFGAHFSKGNQSAKESLDRIGGSGVYARDPDTILVLTKHEEEEAFTVDCTLRNHAPVEPFVVRWQFPLMHRDGSLDPAKLKQVGGRAKEHDGKELLELLGTDELSSAEWQKLAGEENGISRATFFRVLKELTSQKRISKSKLSGKWIQVTKR